MLLPLCLVVLANVSYVYSFCLHSIGIYECTLVSANNGPEIGLRRVNINHDYEKLKQSMAKSKETCALFYVGLNTQEVELMLNTIQELRVKEKILWLSIKSISDNDRLMQFLKNDSFNFDIIFDFQESLHHSRCKKKCRHLIDIEAMEKPQSMDRFSKECTLKSFTRHEFKPLVTVWFDSISPLAFINRFTKEVDGSDPEIMKVVAKHLQMDILFKSNQSFYQMIQQVNIKANYIISDSNMYSKG